MARGYSDELKIRLDMSRSMAWSIAALGRSKTLPSYDSWMRGKSSARQLTGEEARIRSEQHSEDVAAYEAFKASKKSSEETNGD